MKLDTHWLEILKRAWSIKFIVIAGILTAAEVVLPMFEHEIPKDVFAILTLSAVAGAFISRIVVQKDLD
jgi:hypothetical protein